MANDGKGFEQLVDLIERAIQVPNASIEYDARVPELATGRKRQVDVWITIDSGHTVWTAAAEAKDHKRAVSVTTMEQTIKKHEKLGTGELIVYSTKGFSPAAEEDARLHGVVTITPEDLRSDDAERAVAVALETVWLKKAGPVPRACRFSVGGDLTFAVPPEQQVFGHDGTSLTTAPELARSYARRFVGDTYQELVRDVAESTTLSGYSLSVDDPTIVVDGESKALYVWTTAHIDNDRTETNLTPISKVQVDFDVNVEVDAVALRHQRFREALVSHGTGGGATVAFVSFRGEVKGSVRLANGQTAVFPSEADS